MQYWLKGGLIGLAIVIIYDLAILFLVNTNDFGIWFFGLVIDLIIFFIIGSVIGLIVGVVIKRKRKNPLQKKRKIRRKR